MASQSLESAGGVVITQGSEGDSYVALVRKHDGRWVLPKGHREGKETLEAAAMREVEEETGIAQRDLLIRGYLGSFDLNENEPASGIPKLNHFFLMGLRTSERPSLSTDPDHADAAWHRLPVQREVKMAYPYQEELLSVVTDVPPCASGG